MSHSSTAEHPDQHRWLDFLGYSLLFLALWTLTINYLFPVMFALNYQQHWLANVHWDAWPLIHLWLGWVLLTRQTFALNMTLAIAVLELGVCAFKLALFFSAPDWDIWATNQMINDLFVFTLCSALLVTAWRIPHVFPYTQEPNPDHRHAQPAMVTNR